MCLVASRNKYWSCQQKADLRWGKLVLIQLKHGIMKYLVPSRGPVKSSPPPSWRKSHVFHTGPGDLELLSL